MQEITIYFSPKPTLPQVAQANPMQGMRQIAKSRPTTMKETAIILTPKPTIQLPVPAAYLVRQKQDIPRVRIACIGLPELFELLLARCRFTADRNISSITMGL